jgi:hypothetical protein
LAAGLEAAQRGDASAVDAYELADALESHESER